jgi:hypothetical protein
LCKQYIEASICLLSIFEIGKIKQSNHVDWLIRSDKFMVSQHFQVAL